MKNQLRFTLHSDPSSVEHYPPFWQLGTNAQTVGPVSEKSRQLFGPEINIIPME